MRTSKHKRLETWFYSEPPVYMVFKGEVYRRAHREFFDLNGVLGHWHSRYVMVSDQNLKLDILAATLDLYDLPFWVFFTLHKLNGDVIWHVRNLWVCRSSEVPRIQEIEE